MPKHIAPGLMSTMPCSSMVLMSSHKTHYFRRPYAPVFLCFYEMFWSFLALKPAAWTLCPHEGELFGVNYPFHFKPRSNVWMLKTSWQQRSDYCLRFPIEKTALPPVVPINQMHVIYLGWPCWGYWRLHCQIQVLGCERKRHTARRGRPLLS